VPVAIAFRDPAMDLKVSAVMVVAVLARIFVKPSGARQPEGPPPFSKRGVCSRADSAER
jgi:hypothetical protein